MRILHMISGGDIGGAKTHVLTLVHGLQQTNEVCLTCFVEGEFSQDARKMGIDVQVIPTGNVFSAARQVEVLARERKIELLHCHGARANVTATLIHSRLGVPVVSTVHSDPWLDYIGRRVSNMTIGVANRRALRKMDYLIAVSDVTRELLIRHGFAPEKMFTIYNGVDFSEEKTVMPREAYLDSVGLKREPDSVIFGIAARISPVKDMPTLVKAFAKVVAQVPSVRLLIAGDGEDREKLEALVRDTCPEGSVCFAGWVKDIDSFYNALDVNVLSSLSETFPYAITEGARAGCATIASRVGGVPKLVVDGQTGFLFAPGDVDALAGHMLTLAKDGDLRRRLGEAIREKTRQEFSVEATVRTQTQIYETILKQK